MASQLDKEKIRKNIALILDRVKTEADPLLVNEYRAIFKKEVSFFRRSWVAAYLLMCLEQGGLERMKHKSSQREAREPRQYPLAEEDAKRLFISIGRNRRVSPREILGLINAKAGTPRDDIGVIRILDNYSFVQVRESVAEEIIAALNGQSFRGRTLTVNYAKNRRDDETDAAGSETADTGDDYRETAETAGDSDFSEQDQNQSDKEDI